MMIFVLSSEDKKEEVSAIRQSLSQELLQPNIRLLIGEKNATKK
jgi:hypothetical protein